MSKTKKRLLIISGIIVALVVVVILSFNEIVAGIIEKKLDNFLEKHPVKNYELTYKRVGFNLVNRSLRIVGLTFKPEKAYLDSLAATGFSNMIPEINLGKFIVSGINIQDIINDKVFKITHVKVKKAEVILYKIDGEKKPVKKKTEDSVKKTSIIPDSVRVKGINGLLINNITVEKSRVEIYDYKNKKQIFENQKLEIDITDITLTKSKFNDEFLYPNVGDVMLEISKSAFLTGDKFYKIAFDNLKISLSDELVTIQNFRLKPLYSKKNFSKKLEYQKERYDIIAGYILVTLPDFGKLLSENKLYIDKVILNSANIEIYRDKRVPFPHFKRPLLPHQAIKKMELGLNVDTVFINNTEFVYEELTNRNNEPLYISFNGLSGEVSNVCNVKEELDKNSRMKLTLKGKIMNKAPFDLKFIFPMKARNDTFVFTGHVYGKVPMKIFNRAVYPASGVTFDNGYLDKLTFSGGANPAYSKGKMTMLYHDLALTIENKDKDGQNKFLSWGANVAVRKNNPIQGKPVKEAVMFYERDVEKGFGNYIWKTVFSGLKATMILSVNSINKKKYKAITTPKSTPDNNSSKKKNRKKKRSRKKDK